MKYVVRIGDETLEVTLEGTSVLVDGVAIPARLTSLEGTPVRLLTLGDEVHRVLVRRGETRGRYAIWLDGFRHDVEALDERTRAIRALSGAAATPQGPAPLKAPMPGLVVRVNVQPGDQVQAGQGVVVIEAMKMENELRSASAGRVKAVHATPGMPVEKGALLVELE